MIAYLAYPIDAAQADMATAARVRLAVETAVSLLRVADFEVYRPNAAWVGKPSDPDPRLQEMNMETLMSCDVLVALLPRQVPTIGVVVEIVEACRVGMPVVIWRPDANPSYALASMPATTVPRLEQVIPALRRQLEQRSAGAGRPMKVQLLDPAAKLPSRPYGDDAGFDLPCIVKDGWCALEPGETATLHTGLAIEFPPNIWGMVVPRSSTFTRGLTVPIGIVDPGWRGELLVRARNDSPRLQRIQHGERLAQIIPMPLVAHGLNVCEVDQLSDHPRGLSGFGSSGA